MTVFVPLPSTATNAFVSAAKAVAQDFEFGLSPGMGTWADRPAPATASRRATARPVAAPSEGIARALGDRDSLNIDVVLDPSDSRLILSRSRISRQIALAAMLTKTTLRFLDRRYLPRNSRVRRESWSRSCL